MPSVNHVIQNLEIISMSSTDFFFGEKKYLDLNDVNAISKTVTPSHFTTQLNRYLSQNRGSMDIYHGTSIPDFYIFLGAIEKGAIGNIRLKARTDQNSAVDATLSCEILLEQGIVEIIPQWCAYKDIRAEEIVSTLLVPLHVSNLQHKTYLKKPTGELSPLCHDNNYERELKAVYSLSRYPHTPSNEDIASLEAATQIGLEDLSMDSAMNKHFRQVHQQP